MATYTFTILMTPGGSSSPFLRRSIFSPNASFTSSLLLLEVARRSSRTVVLDVARSTGDLAQ